MDSNQSNQIIAPTMKPVVVAAGHRRVLIPKSGRTFPVFLVRLPPIDRIRSRSGDANEPMRDAETPPSGAAFWWRSKHDFLLLGRAAASSPSSSSPTPRPEGSGNGNGKRRRPQFPKSAYAKLSDAAVASGGWIRPLDEVDLFSEEDRTAIVGRLHSPPGVASERSGERGGVIKNGYDPRMKKSVFQMDDFLRGVWSTCDEARQRADEASASGGGKASSDDEDLIAAWRVFCRPGDVESLIGPEGVSSDESGIGATQVGCEKAQDCQTGLKRRLGDSSAARERNAAKLGQYFASEANAKRVVDVAIEKADQCLLRASKRTHSDSQVADWRRIVFVEPSCGDGRILIHLRNELLASGKVPRAILGYDIDPSAVAACNDRLGAAASQGQEVQTETVPVNIRHQDFLALSKESLLADVPLCVDSPTLLKGKGERVKQCPSHFYYVFVGGPPYSNGPGNGTAIKRDLPSLFTRHCILELGAEVVSFLLPSRCESDETASCHALNRNGCVQEEAGEKSLGGQVRGVWRCSSEKLDDSTFDFLGRAVTQPSIISCWSLEYHLD